MAQFTLNVPAAQLPEIQDAFVSVNGYQAQVPDPANPGQLIANPQTPAQFIKQALIDYVKNTVKTYRANSAQSAVLTNVAKVDTDITIT